jgi:hypothetical protein
MFRRVDKKVIDDGSGTKIGIIEDVEYYLCDSCKHYKYCLSLGHEDCNFYEPGFGLSIPIHIGLAVQGRIDYALGHFGIEVRRQRR